MNIKSAHPFAGFFARNRLIVSSDPLLPTAGDATFETRRDEKPYGDGAGRRGRPKAA